MQLGGGTGLLQFLKTLKNLTLKCEVVLKHLHLLVIHLEIALLFLGLKPELLLFELDRFLQAEALFFAGFGVQFHQHLPCLHGIAFLYQDLVRHTTHGHLDVLHRTDRLKLTWGDDYLLGASQGKPSHAKYCRADHRPGDGLHPEPTLLKHRFVVVDEV